MSSKQIQRGCKMLGRRLRMLRRADGNALIELAITLPVLVTALFGVVTGGFVFERYMTVLQLGRNAVSMFSRGTDFSVDANKQLLLLAAQGLNITPTGGEGVIYLTRVEMAPPGSANEGELVIAERHVIGNASVASSNVGQPVAAIWPDPDKPLPNGDVKDHQDQASAVANVPDTLQTLPLGESMYIGEVYHGAEGLRFGQVWPGPVQLATKIYY